MSQFFRSLPWFSFGTRRPEVAQMNYMLPEATSRRLSSAGLLPRFGLVALAFLLEELFLNVRAC
jgi:hypothetical protein